MNNKTVKLLRRYARLQYGIAMKQAAAKHGQLLVDKVANDRNAKAVAIKSLGYRKLERWWKGLPKIARQQACDRMLRELKEAGR